MNHHLIREMLLENAMELYGQPKWTFGKNSCNTYEVFVGQIHLREGGNMPAWPIMEIIEKDEALSLAFSKWFLDAAIRSGVALTEQTDCNVTLSVNLLPAAANALPFADEMAALLERVGMNPRKLQFELTAAHKLNETGIANLNKLHDELGVGLWLSRFGTRESNVDLLREVHFDGVEIDRIFAQNVPDHDQNCRLVVAIQHLAHTLDLLVCAKGIDTQEQFEFFEELDLFKGQGNLIGKPMDMDSMKDYIEKYAVKRGHA